MPMGAVGISCMGLWVCRSTSSWWALLLGGGFVEPHPSSMNWHEPQGHDLGQIAPSYSSLNLGKTQSSNNFLCWGRCQTAWDTAVLAKALDAPCDPAGPTDPGHCCRWGLTAGTRSRKGTTVKGTSLPLHQDLGCPPALWTTGELAGTRGQCHAPLWLQSRGSFLSRDF